MIEEGVVGLSAFDFSLLSLFFLQNTQYGCKLLFHYPSKQAFYNALLEIRTLLES